MDIYSTTNLVFLLIHYNYISKICAATSKLHLHIKSQQVSSWICHERHWSILRTNGGEQLQIWTLYLLKAPSFLETQLCVMHRKCSVSDWGRWRVINKYCPVHQESWEIYSIQPSKNWCILKELCTISMTCLYPCLLTESCCRHAGSRFVLLYLQCTTTVKCL